MSRSKGSCPCVEENSESECLGAKAFALLVKRNSESESFCVCMGQRLAVMTRRAHSCKVKLEE